MDDLELNLNTLAVRAGQVRSSEGEQSEPIFQTTSYVFANAAEAAARFSGEQPGNVYSRYTNPTVRTFEKRLAAISGADDAVATSSGMAAILATCIALLKAGDHLICSRSVFGTTTVLLNKYLGKFGLEVDFVSLTDLDEWRAAVKPNTRMLLLETPSNPLAGVADLRAISEIAKAANAKFVVDNTFCTPALQKPLEWGADISLYSATKYIDGQGRCLGGAVVGSQADMDEILGFIRSTGPSMAPFNAWVFLKGLETLGLRMRAHCESAQALAEWLNAQPQIDKVYYAGLPEHPGHELAKAQQKGFGGVVSFEVKGGRDAAWRFIDATRVISITANLGDAKSTIVHPATTTHGRLTPEEREAAGIRDNLIRVSVGLEDIGDIIADLQRGLDAL